MSNPTMSSECTAEEAYKWTNGEAIFASGSPFEDVELVSAENGVQRFSPSQANNMYIFPGVGMGVIACKASSVPEEFFFTAAETLSTCLTDEDVKLGKVFCLHVFVHCQI
eukprot:m.267787 g.267787  ORF g.267787 m.267787 type:complete len:110 (+) comp15645_c1_seq2:201-530(+)